MQKRSLILAMITTLFSVVPLQIFNAATPQLSPVAQATATLQLADLPKGFEEIPSAFKP